MTECHLEGVFPPLHGCVFTGTCVGCGVGVSFVRSVQPVLVVCGWVSVFGRVCTGDLCHTAHMGKVLFGWVHRLVVRVVGVVYVFVCVHGVCLDVCWVCLLVVRALCWFCEG